MRNPETINRMRTTPPVRPGFHAAVSETELRKSFDKTTTAIVTIEAMTAIEAKTR